MAIYLGNKKVSGAGVQVDSALSDTSTRPVENKVVTEALEDVGYSTWQKPSDWIDIRSGALPNSVYFLVGHSADYSQYPTFAVYATVSNSGTYDVFVDGIKQATTASKSITTLDWQTLALESGWDVTYPTALKTHVVRVTPTLSTDTFTSCRTDGLGTTGLLWIHYALTYALSINNLTGNSSANWTSPLIEAVTAQGDTLTITEGPYGAFRGAYSLKKLPTIDLNHTKINGFYNFLYKCSKLPAVKLQNGVATTTGQMFFDCTALKQVSCQNASIDATNNTFNGCRCLQAVPNLSTLTGANLQGIFSYCSSLKETVLDLSGAHAVNRLTFVGSWAAPLTGIKGLTVSNDAPFDNATSPQLDVRYAGLDRAALVNLFKSMPYNVGYTVVGSPTIENGIATNLSNRVDYLQLSQQLPSVINSFEMVVRCNCGTNSSLSNSFGYFVSGAAPAGYYQFGDFYAYTATSTSNRSVTWRYKTMKTPSEEQHIITAPKGSGLAADVDTLVYTKLTMETVATGDYLYSIFQSLDGVNWTLLVTQHDTYCMTGDDIGPITMISEPKNTVGNRQYHAKTIDLNNTYIKVNGVPWFTGVAAMTKTCSIVGCTGTADLTQEDKNIALDKGWSLTVA